ncbi:MAG TPA: metalloregulator ArsR/SmtB family transcription factor [Thermomicrobiales bacterium]|nr:metalloregulator ArsR/SmtB family transcription factor [Thermomicrobiales bacterium]
MSELFAILADDTRRGILDLLRERECSVNELVEAFPVSQPAISRHLRVLREAGLVRVRSAGQQRIYGLDAARLAEIDTWLAPYRRFWARKLDALEAHLNKED